jgi:hypothetical protein
MQMKLDVLSAMHFIAEAWKLITPTTIKNCFVKCGFSNDHVSSNDDNAVKLTEDEDDPHSLHLLGVQFEDYTCDSTPEFCGIQSVDQVLDQQLTRSEEEPEGDKEVAEHKATFLDALKGLEAARKYIHQFHTKNNITVKCNNVQNELYRMRAQRKK